ncbi:Exonuclease GOR [Saguinus oedipus]|uniref:Exonuclease GOR n=1 Tax=Saguinus oedipus TaxID=9490 RepID=A0ABQ9UES0_SAGOE|nr:Exonuclease GOR [Saguinus oedipus]
MDAASLANFQKAKECHAVNRSAETILIRHSLESDLLALKLIHKWWTRPCYFRTTWASPTRSLRNLTADYLGRVIQDGQDGHSSSEDANACLQLVMWKVRELPQTQPCQRPPLLPPWPVLSPRPLQICEVNPEL